MKCGSLPAKANPSAQREFYEKTLRPLIGRAKKNKVALLFIDASHFVMGCDHLGYIYGRMRRFIRTYSGRSRCNVLAALDFASKKMTAVTNDAYIAATEVCELITKVSIEYAGKAIFLVLDNARYQKCKIKGKLRIKYYDNFDEFKVKIDSIINSTDKTEKFAVDKLIGEKVQLFDHIVVNNVVCLPKSSNATKVRNKAA